MRVYVDADACPVIEICIKLCKEQNVPITLVCDTNHIFISDYAEVITVGAGADAADYKIINLCSIGDIIVTQDYGVAAMAIAKNAYAIHQSGMIYSKDNIDGLLNQRYQSAKLRRSHSKSHIKGPKKRTTENDKAFEDSFSTLLKKIMM